MMDADKEELRWLCRKVLQRQVRSAGNGGYGCPLCGCRYGGEAKGKRLSEVDHTKDCQAQVAKYLVSHDYEMPKKKEKADEHGSDIESMPRDEQGVL